MTPALKTLGILLASAGLVGSSILLSVAPRSAITTAEPTPVSSTSSNRYLHAQLESSHLLRGSAETHLAISVTAPPVNEADVRPPISVAIVLDRSGSMEGERLLQAKRAAIELIEKLDSNDRFSVTLYGTDVATIIANRSATDEAKRIARSAISSIRDGGSTNLSGGLRAGREQLRADDDSIRRIILISDGKANHGITHKDGLAALARETAAAGVSITTVGIGLDFDEQKMTAIAIAGRGNYYFAERPSELSPMFATELGRVTATAATNVAVSFVPASGIEVLEAYGYSLHGETVQLADLHAGETRRVVLRIRGRLPSNGTSAVGTARLTMTGAQNGAAVVEETALRVTVTDDHHAVTRSLDKDTVTIVEKARTAVSLEQATSLYESGDRAGAQRVINARRQEAAKKAAAVGSRALGDEMKDIAEAAEMSFAAEPESPKGKSNRKRNRAKSFEMLH